MRSFLGGAKIRRRWKFCVRCKLCVRWKFCVRWREGMGGGMM